VSLQESKDQAEAKIRSLESEIANSASEQNAAKAAAAVAQSKLTESTTSGANVARRQSELVEELKTANERATEASTAAGEARGQLEAALASQRTLKVKHAQNLLFKISDEVVLFR